MPPNEADNELPNEADNELPNEADNEPTAEILRVALRTSDILFITPGFFFFAHASCERRLSPGPFIGLNSQASESPGLSDTRGDDCRQTETRCQIAKASRITPTLPPAAMPAIAATLIKPLQPQRGLVKRSGR